MGLRGQIADPLDLSESIVDLNLSRMDQAGAAFQLAQRDTAMLHSFKQIRRMKLEAEDSPLILPDQANEMAPDIPKPFEEPIKLSVLQDIIAEHELQKDLQFKIALGPQDLLSTGMQFGASLLAHALDPIEFGAGALMTPATSAIGSRMITSSIAGAGKVPISVGRIGVALARSDKATFARLATEGLAGNLAVEPFIYAGTIADHQDANIYDSFVSVVGGSLGFAAAIKGLSLMPSYVAKLGSAAVGAHTRVSVGQFGAGKKVTTSKMTKALIKESYEGGPRADMEVGGLVSKKTGAILDMEHDHRPFDASAELGSSKVVPKLKGRRWYIASRSKKANIEPLQTMSTGRQFGSGITLSDNPVITNGVASNSTLKNPGSVYEVDLDNISYVTDLDNQILAPKSHARKNLGESLKNIGLNKSEVTTVLKNSPTYMQAWDRLRLLHSSGKLKGVEGADIIKLDEKFSNMVPGDALKYETSSTLGVDHRPQNNLFIKKSTLEWMDKKGKAPFRQVDRYDANPEFNRLPTKQELGELSKDYQSKETDRFHDREAIEEYNSLNPANDPVVGEVNEIFQANKKALDDLAAADEFIPEELEVYERIQRVEAEHIKEMEISREAYNCRIGI